VDPNYFSLAVGDVAGNGFHKCPCSEAIFCNLNAVIDLEEVDFL